MPVFKMNDDGVLVDGEGNPLQLNGEAVTVEGAFTQKVLDAKIAERLARQAKTVRDLEEAVKETPALKQALEQAKADLAETQQQAQQAKAAAEAEVSGQLKTWKEKSERSDQALAEERAARVREQVTVQLLGAAGSEFLNPAADVVPRLLGTHKREPVKGPDGKDTGQFVDQFKVVRKDDKGATVEEWLPADEAIKAFKADPGNRHYLAASGQGGSGGSGTGDFSGLDRAKMSVEQKAKFISDHGSEAYDTLPYTASQ